ncbi:MAG: class I SAM-dependent methyltransferase [Gemmatimonadetes bacterium]|nr:class I SAM-dependent methyltransferase [Gemmatimonadota bacterium]
MQRVPEPELMSAEEQARAYAGADFEEPHGNFIRLLKERLPGLPEQGTALDLGCGPGDIGIRFARAFPGWKVHGLDGSAAMLALAREAVDAAGLAHRIELIEARLQDGRPPAAAYGLVFSNSLLHHLDDPALMWESVRRHAQPGGQVFAMDLMRPESESRLGELAATFRGEPEVLQRDFRNSLRAAYRLGEVRLQLEEAGMSGLQVGPGSDRHLIVWGEIPV